MNHLPLELIEQILLGVDYATTVNYCQTNTVAARLCNDVPFWRKKLDTNFGRQRENLVFIPSDYVKQYWHPESARMTYIRWETVMRDQVATWTMEQVLEHAKDNIDIIFFLMAYLGYEVSDYEREVDMH
jgi:hypothetical protein